MESRTHLLIKLFLLIPFFAFAVSAQIKLVPLAEGWAKNQVNAVVFRKNSLTTFRNSQFVAFYDENSKVVVAKRKLNSDQWEIRPTGFFGQTADAHNSISLAVDGAGFLHLAWNHHNTPLQYAQSLKPESLEFGGKQSMTGATENKVTYPEFYNLPSGDLLFLYRDGGSGNGNLVLNRYDFRTKKWLRVQNNLIDGENSRNAYPQMAVDAKGAIHLSWVWRETPDVASNHDLCYAKSTDGGRTWRKSSGEQYQLPITAKNAEYVWRIPPNSELINQTSMTADQFGKPYITTYWRAADSKIPQYRLVHFDGKKWHAAQVLTRTQSFSLSGQGTKRIPISRPQIAVDSNGGATRVFYVFRDAERGNRVSAAITENLRDNVWRQIYLTDTEVGMWEPTFDQNLWNRKKELHLFVQKVGQGDGETLENLPPQMISILEWKP